MVNVAKNSHWEREDHAGLETPPFFRLDPLSSLWESVCVSVRVLAFQGAHLLAHVGMCVRVHLSPFVVTPGPTLHERTPTDLRPFNSVAAPPRESVWMWIRALGLKLLYSQCYWTEHSRTLHLCSGIQNSEQLLEPQPLKTYISNKQEFSLDSRGRCLGWINQGFTVTGSQLFCGYNHYWQQQPELTAWSWPLTSLFGVATPLTTAHLDVLWMCQF